MDHDQRLRRDGRLLTGDPEAAALFECLAQHIFDPALDTGFMGRVCGAPRAVRDRLAAKIGPLKDYVTQLRMAEAARLVRDTEVPITEIGKRVGYLVPRTFRRAFANTHGVKPSEIRQQARPPDDANSPDDAEAAPTAGKARAPAPNTDDARLTRRALARRMRRQRDIGLLDASAATELRFKLRRHHPQLDAEPTTPSGHDPPARTRLWHPIYLTPTGDWLEEIAANSAYGEILDMPEDDRRFALLHGLRLANVTALFQLSRICQELLQYNADKALNLARLGVEMIEPHREHMGDEADHFKALAWVELGRIQAHAGDCGGADQSLSFARAEVHGQDSMKSWVEIELRRVEGVIRKRQRRSDEAARAMDRAVELGRQLERSHPDRRQTVLERLELASSQGDADAGFALIQELEKLIETFPEDDKRRTFWRAIVFFHGGKAHAANGSDCCARRCLREAMSIITADSRCDTDRQLGILFTFIIHDLARLSDGEQIETGETLLRHTLERYQRFEIPVLGAAAEAELAVVCALRGHVAEARELATKAADFLDDLPPLHREAWKAVRRLRALANGGAEAPESELTELLAKLRRDLDLVAWEITGSQAMAAARARQTRDAGAASTGAAV